MSSAELPDADAIEQQQTLVDDTEDCEDDLRELPTEVDPADAIEQHRGLGGDDAEDYPRDWVDPARLSEQLDEPG